MRKQHRQSLLLLATTLAVTVACRAQDKPTPAKVTIQVDKESIEFRAGDLLSSRLEIGLKQAKPYFWPLNAPNGKPVTRAWPMEKAGEGGSVDHPHQKSAWFTYGDIIPEGVELKFKIKGVEGVDFWAETQGHGRIVFDPRAGQLLVRQPKDVSVRGQGQVRRPRTSPFARWKRYFFPRF